MTAFYIPGNLAFDSYTELVAAINDWMDRSDLSGAAQQMIALAEARMARRLEPLFDEVSATVTATDGIGPLPTDISVLKRVIYNNNTLPRYSSLTLSDKDADTSATIPTAYSLEANALRVWPACDVDVTVLYQPRLARLSDADPSNSILADYPDAYFFGAMMFAEGYVANDNRAGMFKGLFDEALGEVEAFISRQRFTGPLAPRLRREF